MADNTIEEIVVTARKLPENTYPEPLPPSRSFNIQNFRSEINGKDILPTHSYLVVFSLFNSESAGIKNLSNFINNNGKQLVLRCDSAQLPGASLLKDDNVRRFGYGPIEQVPYGIQFNDLTLSWIVDRNAEIVEFFHQWMSIIVNHNSAGGGNMTSIDRYSTYSPYEVGYKDSYVNKQMNIFVYDRASNKTIEYEIYDVFIKQINDMSMAWDNQNSIMRLNTVFAYTDYIIKAPRSGNLTDSQPLRELDPINAFVPVPNQTQQLSTISNPDATNPNGISIYKSTQGLSNKIFTNTTVAGTDIPTIK